MWAPAESELVSVSITVGDLALAIIPSYGKDVGCAHLENA